MSNLNAWIAQRGVNFTFLMGNYIDDITFTILDEDGDAFPFAGLSITEFTIRIYDSRITGRALIETHTEATELSESAGIITWDAVFPTDMTFGDYNYELDYTDTEGDKRLAEGRIKVV
ncbi:MAG TPA: hypothetical protein ENH82_16600 [bacterium]|nr:hypothetical protein [bacterium]